MKSSFYYAKREKKKVYLQHFYLFLIIFIQNSNKEILVMKKWQYQEGKKLKFEEKN